MFGAKYSHLDTHGELVPKSMFQVNLTAIRHVLCATVAVGVAGCGSVHSPFQIGDIGDAASQTGGSTGNGGASGGAPSNDAGGSAGAGGDPSICHTSNLSSAPLPCLQDFTHVKAKYGVRCTTDGGYQAACAPYDALVYHSGNDDVWCYYDQSTGNLIGARETMDPQGTGGTCVQFDRTFMEPAIASCAPADGSACPSP
jgi:hypothetical protein